MKLVRVDNDNARVYYRGEGTGGLFCWQEDKPGAFTLYACTRDGEPSHRSFHEMASFPPPSGETATGAAFIAFLDPEPDPCTCIGVCHCYGWAKANGD